MGPYGVIGLFQLAAIINFLDFSIRLLAGAGNTGPCIYMGRVKSCRPVCLRLATEFAAPQRLGAQSTRDGFGRRDPIRHDPPPLPHWVHRSRFTNEAIGASCLT